jgi:hypothetical protein
MISSFLLFIVGANIFAMRRYRFSLIAFYFLNDLPFHHSFYSVVVVFILAISKCSDYRLTLRNLSFTSKSMVYNIRNGESKF